MTPAEVLEVFTSLRTGSREGQRLPHKPLLVLLALGRWANGHRDSVAFGDVQAKLLHLIRTYGPKGAGSPEEPFWRLRRDGLWELGGLGHLPDPDAASPPGVRAMKAVTGQFTGEVHAALEQDPTLVNQLAQAILEANFPASLRPDIAAEAGLDLEETPVPITSSKRRRDPDFRSRVLQAYGNRCALCRVKLHVGLVPLGLEAAHIRWFQFDGPDEMTNGLSLCAFHHKAFDLGAFTAEPDGRVLVSEEVNGDGQDVLLSGKPLSLEPTACKEDRPKAEFLEWHRSQVFRGRPRG
jgi:putative restriction endonuclease